MVGIFQPSENETTHLDHLIAQSASSSRVHMAGTHAFCLLADSVLEVPKYRLLYLNIHMIVFVKLLGLVIFVLIERGVIQQEKNNIVTALRPGNEVRKRIPVWLERSVLVQRG